MYNVMLILTEADGGKDRALHVIISFFIFVDNEPEGKRRFQM